MSKDNSERRVRPANYVVFATADITRALRTIDDARRKLAIGRRELRTALANADDVTRQDFERFWASGGCTVQQWKEWLWKSKASKERAVQVPKKRGLRLVVKNRPVRYKRKLPPDTPEAA